MLAPVVACIAATLTLASPAGAQERWPQRQVTIVVPFAAGGSADLLARILQQHMQPTLGVPFVVENRPGRRQHRHRLRGKVAERRLHLAARGR